MNPVLDALDQSFGDTVLERLRTARATIDDYPFQFSDWTACTCGHVYAAALGTEPFTDYTQRTAAYLATKDRIKADDADPLYVAMLRAIAPDAAVRDRALHAIVSTRTLTLAGERNIELRDAARLLLDAAIERVEAGQREAMALVAAGALSDREREPVEA